MKRARNVVLGLAMLAGAACGRGAPSDCGRVEPCGGDLVGTWQLSGTCATNPVVPVSFCAAATVAHSTFHVSGSATFGADGSFAISATKSGTIEYAVPASCLVLPGGGSESCAQLTPTVPAGLGVQCVEEGDGCHCTFVIAPRDVAESGTYVSKGTSLSAVPAGGQIDGASYCVAGDRLHLLSIVPIDAGAADAGAPLVFGDLVGTKS
jgi:hypothetical protein